MKNYLFPIVGLRYHDFKDRLEELYRTAVGKTISLDVEEDNRAEANAVAAYMGTLRVGYVRTDMRALACGVAHDCDDELPMGVVERVDAENRVIWVNFDVDDEVAPEPNTMPNVLTNWHYEGAKLLPYPEVMKGLNVCTMSLKTVLKRNPDRWTEEMESWLCSFEQCFAYDISGKASDDRARILEMLTALTPKDAAFGRAAARMEYAIREMAGVESSQRQAQMVRDMAVSDEMDKLLTRLHDDAATTAAQLPQVLRDEMKNNLSLLLTRVFYWRVPKMKLQDVLSLMALNLRLEMDGEKKKDEEQQVLADQKRLDKLEDYLSSHNPTSDDTTAILTEHEIAMQDAAPAVKKRLRGIVQRSTHAAKKSVSLAAQQGSLVQISDKEIYNQLQSPV